MSILLVTLGRIDPAEIVRFATRMNQKVNAQRFWALFGDIDLDNSSDLDVDEFIGVMDALTEATMTVPSTAVSTRAIWRCSW